MQTTDSLERLYLEAQTRRISRRAVLRRAVALGLTAPAIAGLLAACGGDDDDEAEATPTSAAQATPTPAAAAPTATATTAAQPTTASTTVSASPTASQAAASPTARAATATSESGKGRGEGDLLRVLYWLSPTILNPHLNEAGNDAVSPVLEPLTDFDPAGNIVPVLAAEVPSLENGGVAVDGLSVTYTLRDDVVWSDGEPFTAEDVRFTWQFIVHPEANSTSFAAYDVIQDVEVVDERTVTIHFKQPNPAWFGPFSTSFRGHVLPKHLLQDFMGAKGKDAEFSLKPIGTGPYRVDEFRPGDVILFSINERYREADKPFFQRIEYKGGGDATAAARAVLQTAEVDFAINLQVEKQILEQLQQQSETGELLSVESPNVDLIHINFTDPNKEVDGERSKLGNPHPFLSDLAVRQALSLACDRETIATELFGAAGTPTANALVAPLRFASPNTSYEFNVEKGAQLLDEAGWTVQDDIRQKDGVQMRMLWQAATNPLRQKVQEVIKEALEGIGMRVEIKAVDSGVFFSPDAGNPDTVWHFYADLASVGNGPEKPYPTDYMAYYKSSDPERDIPQKSNGWSGLNISRWVNEEFNGLYEQALTELDPDKQAELFIGMNDLVVNDVVVIPLVNRTRIAAKNKKLKGVALSPWTTQTWDIRDWYWEE